MRAQSSCVLFTGVLFTGLVWLGLLFGSEVVCAQSAEVLESELRRRVNAQAAAKRSGDLPTIATDSRSLAALLLRLLADMRLAAGRGPEAIDLYRRSLSLNEEPVTAYSLAKQFLRRGEKAEATEIFERLLGRADGSAEFRLLVGVAYLEADYFEDAIGELEVVLARDPNQHRASLQLGRAYWLLSEKHGSPQAVAAMRAAVAGDPTSYEARYFLGQMESQNGRYAEASVHLRAAALSQPRSPEPWLQLGLNAFADGDLESAAAELEKGIALGVGDSDQDLIRRAHVVLSRLAVARGDLQEGERLFSRRREPRTKNSVGAPSSVSNEEREEVLESRRRKLVEVLASVLFDWGSAEASRGNLAEAVRLFRDAEGWKPDTPLLMRRLGIAAFQAGDYAESARALAAAAELDPRDRPLKKFLALALASTERFTDAIKVFSEVEELLFDDPRAAYIWALSLVRARQPERAREVLARLGDLPLPPPALVPMAALRSELGDHQVALQLLERAAAAAPDHPGIGQALAKARRLAGE